MADKASRLTRRGFLKNAVKAGAAIAAPMVLPARVLGLDGTVPPSEQIRLGAIGIGNRGSYVFRCFLGQPDVVCLAVCDVQAHRRDAAKKAADGQNKNENCTPYHDFRDLLGRKDIDAVMIATGPNWHATASIEASRYGKDVYCEKPSSKNIAQSLALAAAFKRSGGVFQAGTQRRSLPNFMHAAELARRGQLGKLTTLYAHPGGLGTSMSGWEAAQPEPSKEETDWDMYLGPAAWRPYNKALMHGFGFEKGGGLTGGGCLEWGSHCVDLCQWANNSDDTAAVEYEPVNGQLHARYANGVKLILRNDGWLPLSSCPVRYEGDAGWVETGDCGDLVANPTSLLAGRRKKIGGYPADFHVRNFLDCVKSRSQPRANAQAACWSHITCHCANIALFLGRKVVFDPVKCEFPGDEEANRLRSEALREPWRI